MRVIVGQPWQHTYNGTPNWKKEGINFETENSKFFMPFLGEEYYMLDFEMNNEERDMYPTRNNLINTTSDPKGTI